MANDKEQNQSISEDSSSAEALTSPTSPQDSLERKKKEDIPAPSKETETTKSETIEEKLARKEKEFQSNELDIKNRNVKAEARQGNLKNVDNSQKNASNLEKTKISESNQQIHNTTAGKFSTSEITDHTSVADITTSQLKDVAYSGFFDLKDDEIINLMQRNNLYKGLILAPESILTTESLENIHNQFDFSNSGSESSDIVTADPLVPSYFNLLEKFKPCYRKPKYEVYFEKLFSFSSRDHQMLKSGASSWKVSSSIGYSGSIVDVSVAGSHSQNEEKTDNNSKSNQTVYLLVRQVVPKVELYFPVGSLPKENKFSQGIDTILNSCRINDKNLLEYLKHTSDSDTRWAKARSVHRCYSQLLLLLSQFGFYYINECTLGGALYSEDVKELSNVKSVSQALDSMASGVSAHAAVGFVYSVAIAGEASKSNSSAQTEAKGSGDESRQVSVSAIGGNPAYIHQPDQWIEKLADWKTWSIVKYNYLPLINLLPRDKAYACLDLLRAFSREPLSASDSEPALVDLDTRVRAAIDLSIYCDTIQAQLKKDRLSVFYPDLSKSG
jgi:hypothetical protein